MTVDLNTIKTSDFQFTPENFELSFGSSLRLWWHGVMDRKNIMKRFCLDNGIDYPPDSSKHYVMPKSYLIDADEIAYLGKIRDNALLKQYDRYDKCQKDIMTLITEIKEKMTSEKAYIEHEKAYLTDLEKELKSATDSSNIISLESRKKSQVAKVENLLKEYSEWEGHRDALGQTMVGNLKSWEGQIGVTNGILDEKISAYCNSATKRIKNQLNFTIFKYVNPDYGDEIKKIIEGKEHERIASWIN